MLRLCFLVFCFLHVLQLKAEGPYILTDKQYDLFEPAFIKALTYTKDSLGKSDFHSISKRTFQPLGPYYLKTHFDTNSKYWIRIPIENRTNNDYWIFEVADPHIQDVEVYVVNDKDTIRFDRTGFAFPFVSRSSKHKNFLFPITIKGRITVYYAFRNNYPPNLTLGLRPVVQFLDYALIEYYLLGLFYGILLIMAVYNLFIYFSTKESLYLYYVAYVISYCLNAFREDGIGFQLLWPQFPVLDHYIVELSPLLLIVAFVGYSQKFLSLSEYAGRLSKVINASLFCYMALFFIHHFTLSLPWATYFYLFPFGLIFIAGIQAWKAGNKSAKYFLLAFSLLVLSFSVFVLRITSLIPAKVYTVYALNFGFLIEVVLFSYALGQRLKIEKEEKTIMDQKLIQQLRENEKLKDSLNNELEVKVKERTLELNNALAELQFKNIRIEELNSLLEKDNRSLNQDIKEITKARLMLKDLTLEDFMKIYPDEESCLKYLSEIKWAKSYSCKKCVNTNYSEGKMPFSRRCTRCGYEESATAFTLFHKSKIPITTNFYLVYLVLAHKNISSVELSKKLGLRQKTCWFFKKRVLETIENSTSPKLNSKEWGRVFYESKK